MNNTEFRNCFKKHFPESYQMFSNMEMLFGEKIEKATLISVQKYDGAYELEDSLMGAYLIHIAVGNIENKVLVEEINRYKVNYSFTSEFIHDINELNNY